MNKEEKKKYVFAQLKSLPNTFQYVEVVEYIKSLEQENANLKQSLNEIREYIKKIKNFYWVEDDEPQYVSEDILQIIDKVLGDDNRC